MFQKRYELRRRNCVQGKRASRAKRLVKTKLPELLLYTSYLHVHINVVTDETGVVGDSNVGGGCGGGGGGAGDSGVIPSTPTSLSSEISMDSAQFPPHRPASVSSNGDARTGVADLGDTSTNAITNHHHQLQNQSSLVSQNDTTINTSVSSSAPSTPTAGTKLHFIIVSDGNGWMGELL